jgi:RNA polymerase sigma-70 factor (ECF subfamily)
MAIFEEITRTMEHEPCAALFAEKDLVARAKTGDREAFQELMAQCRHKCLHMATIILRNSDDAEDEVQNTFWKAYRHLPLFNEQCTFSTWVTRIVINHCITRYRRSKRIRFVPYEIPGAEGEWYTAHEPATTSGSPEELLGCEEVRAALRFELGRIPVLLRTPVQLYFIDGLSIQQVSAALGISVTAAKSRLHRGEQYLRSRMLRHCGRLGLATLTNAA